jgi:hypothetical protein
MMNVCMYIIPNMTKRNKMNKKNWIKKQTETINTEKKTVENKWFGKINNDTKKLKKKNGKSLLLILDTGQDYRVIVVQSYLVLFKCCLHVE